MSAVKVALAVSDIASRQTEESHLDQLVRRHHRPVLESFRPQAVMLREPHQADLDLNCHMVAARWPLGASLIASRCGT